MFIKSFNQLSKNDTGIAGGKGASLGEMAGAGMPVPDGFVILVEAFDKFLDETDLVPEIAAQIAKINYKDINSVERASNVIRDLFCDAKMPKDLGEEILIEYNKLAGNPHLISSLRKGDGQRGFYVAVRSSATAEDSAVASWAGELESYLNTTRETLFENIKKCWSSLFTPRALFYAFEKNMISVGHQKKIRAKTCKKLCDCYSVCVAVVVQKMIQSEVSGICFTVHPVTEDRNQMVIEAGWGLGEAIVGGKITPDTYVIRKFPISNFRFPKKSQISNSKIRVIPAKSGIQILDKNISQQEMMIVRSAKGTAEVGVPKAKQGKQKLSDDKIIELAKICLDIEKHYGKPQDIEWAMEKGKIYIVQSRPITTL